MNKQPEVQAPSPGQERSWNMNYDLANLVGEPEQEEPDLYAQLSGMYADEERSDRLGLSDINIGEGDVQAFKTIDALGKNVQVGSRESTNVLDRRGAGKTQQLFDHLTNPRKKGGKYDEDILPGPDDTKEGTYHSIMQDEIRKEFDKPFMVASPSQKQNDDIPESIKDAAKANGIDVDTASPQEILDGAWNSNPTDLMGSEIENYLKGRKLRTPWDGEPSK